MNNLFKIKSDNNLIKKWITFKIFLSKYDDNFIKWFFKLKTRYFLIIHTLWQYQFLCFQIAYVQEYGPYSSPCHHLSSKGSPTRSPKLHCSAFAVDIMKTPQTPWRPALIIETSWSALSSALGPTILATSIILDLMKLSYWSVIPFPLSYPPLSLRTL